jgi:hypothetical protein
VAGDCVVPGYGHTVQTDKILQESRKNKKNKDKLLTIEKMKN